MMTSEQMKKLLKAGVTAEQMVIFTEIMEEKQSVIDEQKAKARDRKRKQRDMSRDSHGTVTGQSQDTPQDKKERTKEKNSTPLNSPPKGGSYTPQNPPDDFERFWKAYPPQRRKNKPEALKRWKLAVKSKPAEEILQAVIRYGQTVEVAEGYDPQPAKWLKEERFNDDFEEQDNAAITKQSAKQSGQNTGGSTVSSGGGGAGNPPRKSKWDTEAERLSERYAAEDAEARAFAGVK